MPTESRCLPLKQPELITPDAANSDGTTTGDEHEQEGAWSTVFFPGTETFDTFQGQADPAFFCEVVAGLAAVPRPLTRSMEVEGISRS